MAGKPWTSEDLETLARLRGEGRTGREIAQALGRTVSAIRYRIWVLNYPPLRDRTAWTRDDLESLMRMRAEGLTHREIAEALGRTTRSVKDKIHYLKPSQRPVEAAGGKCVPVMENGLCSKREFARQDDKFAQAMRRAYGGE